MAGKASSRGRGRGEALLAVGAVLAVGLLVGGLELGLRLLRHSPCPGATDPTVMACLHAYSEEYGWALRPGIRLEAPPAPITINALGYRGRALARGRAPGKTRVVVLGDSLAFGLDVADDETFSQRLEAADARFEVANLSVAGYGTDQSLLKLEGEGLSEQPDVVVLSLCRANDFADNSLPTFLYDGIHPKPFFRLEAGELRLFRDHLRLGWRSRLGNWLRDRSFLYNALIGLSGAEGRRVAQQEQARSRLPHWETRANDALRDPDQAVELTAALIRRMRDLLREKGVGFVALGFPMRKTFETESSDLVGRLKSRLGEVRLVLMGKRFRANGYGYRELTLDGLGHLSPRGHAVAAEILAEVLAEEGLIEPDGGRNPASP